MNIDNCVQNLIYREQKQEQKLADDYKKRKQAINRIYKILKQNKIKGKFYLFGSTAEGNIHLNSDLDIAVEKIPYDKYFKIWTMLSDQIDDYLIDLRDITDRNDFFAEQM